MLAKISQYRDTVKVLKEQIILPDKNGKFWAHRHGLTKDDIALAKLMGIRFYKHGSKIR